MSINLARLPDEIAVGATVGYSFETVKNTSEGGISGRKSFRTQVIRNYMVAVAPGAPAREFQNILLSVMGQRYPLKMRDPTSYTLVEEPLTDFTVVGGTTHVPLYKTFLPATGTRHYRQRILVPDLTTLEFNLNGSPLIGSPAAPTIIDPGIAVINSVLTGSDDLVVSGEYFVPVCIVDTASSNVRSGPISHVIFDFPDVRLEEILENELIALTA